MTGTGGAVLTPAHACAVPTSDEQLWEMSARFVADGLAANERVVYFDDGTAEAVLERLTDDRVAVRGPLAEGQLAIVPPEATRAALSGPVEDAMGLLRASIDESLAQGFDGWRMTGQMSHARRRLGGVGLAEYDAAMAAEIAGRPAKALCFYDRRRYPDPAIEELRAAHEHEITAPAVYDDALLRVTSAGPARVRLAGEVDHSNRPMIARLVESALDEALRSHSAPTDVTVDLASLRFLDVAGAVSLVHAAEAFPSTHRLVLEGVRAPVLRVLDRCGAPFAAQLVVSPRVAHDPAEFDPVESDPVTWNAVERAR
jgi:anti-anti-sigma factor